MFKTKSLLRFTKFIYNSYSGDKDKGNSLCRKISEKWQRIHSIQNKFGISQQLQKNDKCVQRVHSEKLSINSEWKDAISNSSWSNVQNVKNNLKPRRRSASCSNLYTLERQLPKNVAYKSNSDLNERLITVSQKEKIDFVVTAESKNVQSVEKLHNKTCKFKQKKQSVSNSLSRSLSNIFRSNNLSKNLSVNNMMVETHKQNEGKNMHIHINLKKPKSNSKFKKINVKPVYFMNKDKGRNISRSSSNFKMHNDIQVLKESTHEAKVEETDFKIPSVNSDNEIVRKNEFNKIDLEVYKKHDANVKLLRNSVTSNRSQNCSDFKDNFCLQRIHSTNRSPNASEYPLKVVNEKSDNGLSNIPSLDKMYSTTCLQDSRGIRNVYTMCNLMGSAQQTRSIKTNIHHSKQSNLEKELADVQICKDKINLHPNVKNEIETNTEGNQLLRDSLLANLNINVNKINTNDEYVKEISCTHLCDEYKACAVDCSSCQTSKLLIADSMYDSRDKQDTIKKINKIVTGDNNANNNEAHNETQVSTNTKKVDVKLIQSRGYKNDISQNAWVRDKYSYTPDKNFYHTGLELVITKNYREKEYEPESSEIEKILKDEKKTNLVAWERYKQDYKSDDRILSFCGETYLQKHSNLETPEGTKQDNSTSGLVDLKQKNANTWRSLNVGVAWVKSQKIEDRIKSLKGISDKDAYNNNQRHFGTAWVRNQCCNLQSNSTGKIPLKQNLKFQEDNVCFNISKQNDISEDTNSLKKNFNREICMTTPKIQDEKKLEINNTNKTIELSNENKNYDLSDENIPAVKKIIKSHNTRVKKYMQLLNSNKKETKNEKEIDLDRTTTPIQFYSSEPNETDKTIKTLSKAKSATTNVLLTSPTKINEISKNTILDTDNNKLEQITTHKKNEIHEAKSAKMNVENVLETKADINENLPIVVNNSKSINYDLNNNKLNNKNTINEMKSKFDVIDSEKKTISKVMAEEIKLSRKSVPELVKLQNGSTTNVVEQISSTSTKADIKDKVAGIAKNKNGSNITNFIELFNKLYDQKATAADISFTKVPGKMKISTENGKFNIEIQPEKTNGKISYRVETKVAPTNLGISDQTNAADEITTGPKDYSSLTIDTQRELARLTEPRKIISPQSNTHAITSKVSQEIDKKDTNSEKTFVSEVEAVKLSKTNSNNNPSNTENTCLTNNKTENAVNSDILNSDEAKQSEPITSNTVTEKNKKNSIGELLESTLVLNCDARPCYPVNRDNITEYYKKKIQLIKELSKPNILDFPLLKLNDDKNNMKQLESKTTTDLNQLSEGKPQSVSDPIKKQDKELLKSEVTNKPINESVVIDINTQDNVCKLTEKKENVKEFKETNTNQYTSVSCTASVRNSLEFLEEQRNNGLQKNNETESKTNNLTDKVDDVIMKMHFQRMADLYEYEEKVLGIHPPNSNIFKDDNSLNRQALGIAVANNDKSEKIDGENLMKTIDNSIDDKRKQHDVRNSKVLETQNSIMTALKKNPMNVSFIEPTLTQPNQMDTPDQSKYSTNENNNLSESDTTNLKILLTQTDKKINIPEKFSDEKQDSKNNSQIKVELESKPEIPNSKNVSIIFSKKGRKKSSDYTDTKSLDDILDNHTVAKNRKTENYLESQLDEGRINIKKVQYYQVPYDNPTMRNTSELKNEEETSDKELTKNDSLIKNDLNDVLNKPLSVKEKMKTYLPYKMSKSMLNSLFQAIFKEEKAKGKLSVSELNNEYENLKVIIQLPNDYEHEITTEEPTPKHTQINVSEKRYPLLNIKKYKAKYPKFDYYFSSSDHVDNILYKHIPSVSKILNETLPNLTKKALNNWENNRLNHLDESELYEYYQDQIINDIQFHDCIRRHILGTPINVLAENSTIATRGCLISLQKIFSRLTNVTLLEGPVVHSHLPYHGIVDCVGCYEDTPMVIEWKQADNPRALLQLTYDAPIQLAAYIGAINFDMQYQFPVTSGMIVVAYTDGSPADAFYLSTEDCQKYWKLWLKRLQSYMASK